MTAEESSNGKRSKARRKGKRRDEAMVSGEQESVTTNIGATAYRLGDREPTRALLAVNLAYFSAGEGAEFVSFLHTEAAALGLILESEAQVVGMWQGDLEPAISVDVTGLPPQIEKLAKSLGKRYNQESVMLFQRDPAASGNLYAIQDVHHEEADLAFREMLRQGLSGGRYVNGRIEVVDIAGELGANVTILAGLLGKTLVATAGYTRFLSREEGDY